MKKVIVHMMNWMARPYGHINIVILLILACAVFLAGCAVAFKPYTTEFLDILGAPKLRILVRIIGFAYLSVWCVLGSICRALIYFFPDDFQDSRGNI